MTGSLPKISVITPSYNQGQFIEETIRSVLDQNYPSLEFIIMDGGSTDGTVEILRRYDSALAFWTSERDRGQADAVNRGFARATGDLVVWINSDDLLMRGSLAAYADAHVRAPNDVLLGDMVIFDEHGPVKVERQRDVTFEGVVVPWLTGTNWLQPATAVPRAVWEKAGLLDESYRYTFDREWACRLFRDVPAARSVEDGRRVARVAPRGAACDAAVPRRDALRRSP
jgi:glycosyltransferase involved in cell wall biosynthesis